MFIEFYKWRMEWDLKKVEFKNSSIDSLLPNETTQEPKILLKKKGSSIKCYQYFDWERALTYQSVTSILYKKIFTHSLQKNGLQHTAKCHFCPLWTFLFSECTTQWYSFQMPPTHPSPCFYHNCSIRMVNYSIFAKILRCQWLHWYFLLIEKSLLFLV